MQKVADPKKNISMHKIPFCGKERPIKKKRRKRWLKFVLESEKKDVDIAKDVLFQNTGTKIYKLLLIFSSLHIQM